MAHTGIFATSDEILVKAGKNYDTDVNEARINALCSQVESLINCVTRYNWSDAYAGLNADVKGILSEVASNLVAIYIISFNMAGYTTRTEAEDMINVLRDGALRGLSILKDKKVQDFMKGA
jgi:cystathionine beta-lyase family protein involved in aluminum resistance